MRGQRRGGSICDVLVVVRMRGSKFCGHCRSASAKRNLSWLVAYNRVCVGMFETLPNEVIHKILFEEENGLSVRDVGALAQTCKQARAVIVEDEDGRDLHRSLQGAVKCLKGMMWRGALFACVRNRWILPSETLKTWRLNNTNVHPAAGVVYALGENANMYSGHLPSADVGGQLVQLLAQAMDVGMPGVYVVDYGPEFHILGRKAVQIGAIEVARELIREYNVDPIEKVKRVCMLYDAIECVKPEMVRMILEEVPGTTLDAGMNGETLKTVASSCLVPGHGEEEMQELVDLVLADPSVDIMTTARIGGVDSVGCAAWFGNAVLARALVADPRLELEPNDPALTLAAVNKNEETFIVLLADGRIDPYQTYSSYGSMFDAVFMEVYQQPSAQSASVMLEALLEDDRIRNDDPGFIALLADVLEEEEPCEPLTSMLMRLVSEASAAASAASAAGSASAVSAASGKAERSEDS